jgi:uncharacterized protein (TIGR03437 family)
MNIAAANLSLGGGKFAANCDAAEAASKAAIDNLRSLGIATVVAAGNESYTGSLSAPACISSAISVGSTGDGSGGTTQDAVSGFSNSASFLNLLAPGELINSSVPGGNFSNFRGTSMATPHVTGAWAALKQKSPNASVSQILMALKDTGSPITDSRNGIARPRIRVDAAVNALSSSACTYGISSATQSFNASGGAATVEVTAGASCAWTASSNVPWISISSGGSSMGNGTVSYAVAANSSPNPRTGTITIAGQTVTITQTGAVASVSAASYSAAGLASEAIAAAFGANLATTTQIAMTIPLPTTLAGTSVKVRDSTGTARDAPLFFVSPSQVNYQIPAGTVTGTATVIITSGNGNVATGAVQVDAVAPGLFAASADGQGVAAALALRVKADGTQQYEPVARYDEGQKKFVAVPLDLGPESEQVFVILFGTGFRYRSSLAAVTSRIGGTNAEVLYAGPQGGFVGLDQANVRLPRSLKGRGEVEVALTVDGKAANIVRISIK